MNTLRSPILTSSIWPLLICICALSLFYLRSIYCRVWMEKHKNFISLSGIWNDGETSESSTAPTILRQPDEGRHSGLELECARSRRSARIQTAARTERKSSCYFQGTEITLILSRRYQSRLTKYLFIRGCNQCDQIGRYFGLWATF